MLSVSLGTRGDRMPLVLASNDANASGYDWKDITGVQYHHPNGYKNLIIPGTPFVYYRGMRRADGSRGQAEYFGRGRIGATWRDPAIPMEAPKRRWAWYCAIDDYEPIIPAIPAKVDGQFFEEVKHRNAWRKGVREISKELFDALLTQDQMGTAEIGHGLLSTLPPLDQLSVRIAGQGLLLPQRGQGSGESKDGRHQTRYSRSAKIVGDRAEEIVFRWIQNNRTSARDIRWLAREGYSPGWDIQFTNDDGVVIAVEVKGTSEDRFVSFELTANELAAMKAKNDAFWLVLVADCLSGSPIIEIIENPCALLGTRFAAEPIRWRLTAASDAGTTVQAQNRELRSLAGS